MLQALLCNQLYSLHFHYVTAFRSFHFVPFTTLPSTHFSSIHFSPLHHHTAKILSSFHFTSLSLLFVVSIMLCPSTFCFYVLRQFTKAKPPHKHHSKPLQAPFLLLISFSQAFAFLLCFSYAHCFIFL